MKNFNQDIDTIISESNNQINDKILGVNYLEKLKYLLIDGLKNIKASSFKEIKTNEILKTYGENNLNIKIENYSSSFSKIKNTLSSDYLCIVLSGKKSIELQNIENSKLSNKLNIFPYTGIVLNNNTIISEFVSDETVLLDIFNFRKKYEI
jgi:hypothetical protein